MKKIALLLLLIGNLITAQESAVVALFDKGNEAFNANNFTLAKDYFEQALVLDTVNKHVLFNLAVTELNLNNVEQACSLLQKGYRLKDSGTRELLQTYCGGIGYEPVMFQEDVDTMPTFKLNGTLAPIKKDSNLHPVLTNAVVKEISKAPFFKKYVPGKIIVIFNINANGKLYCKGVRPEELKTEIEHIYNSIATYKPAMYQGKPTEILGGYSQIIMLKR
jgi:tetratricopeptide (TPR) repeat protein